ncbi:MAG: T9SS type A sorting domain-containing protein [bacterium]|nr:T9SS type A sorting domain-containing protein [bacterium]
MKKIITAIIVFLIITPLVSNAVITFERTYADTQPIAGYSVQQTTDGGYIVAGMSGSLLGDYSYVYLLKTDSLGNAFWTKKISFLPGNPSNAFGWSVRQTTDGGYIITGSIFSVFVIGGWDILLVKTDSLGDTLWTRLYGSLGAANDWGTCVQQTTDGGYIITGTMWDALPCLLKIDSLGDTMWTKVYSLPLGGILSDGNWVLQLDDKGYIIAGTIMDTSFHSGQDVYLIRTDSLGDTLWTKIFSKGAENNNEVAKCIQQTTDSGYIISGSTSSSDSFTSAYLIKTNSSGDTLWTRTFSGSNSISSAFCVQQTTDSGYITTGGSCVVIKTNPSGDTMWTKTYDSPDYDKSFCIQQTSDGGYILTGYQKTVLTHPYDGGKCCLIKMDSLGNVYGIEENEKNDDKYWAINICPNIFAQSIKLTVNDKSVLKDSKENYKVQIYDMGGRLLEETKDMVFGEKLKSGIYFIRIIGKQTNSKFVKIIKIGG